MQYHPFPPVQDGIWCLLTCFHPPSSIPASFTSPCSFPFSQHQPTGLPPHRRTATVIHKLFPIHIIMTDDPVSGAVSQSGMSHMPYIDHQHAGPSPARFQIDMTHGCGCAFGGREHSACGTRPEETCQQNGGAGNGGPRRRRVARNKACLGPRLAASLSRPAGAPAGTTGRERRHCAPACRPPEGMTCR